MYEEYLEFAKGIAYKAKQIMLKYFNNDNEAIYKSDNTIVTIADKEINDLLIKEVKNKYPNHSVDGEEESIGSSNYVWVCDPIDGTAMFARGIPTCVFSLALCIDGDPVVGVVYDPFNDNMYYATKSSGAFKNDEKIHVSNIDLSDKRSVAHYDMHPNFDYNIFDVIKELGKKTYFVSIGSIIRASMCIAEGNFTLAIFPGTTHKNCDIAAVKIIVEEAGGIVTDLFGKEQRYDSDINGAIISNGIMHDEIVKLLKKYLADKNRGIV